MMMIFFDTFLLNFQIYNAIYNSNGDIISDRLCKRFEPKNKKSTAMRKQNFKRLSNYLNVFKYMIKWD